MIRPPHIFLICIELKVEHAAASLQKIIGTKHEHKHEHAFSCMRAKCMQTETCLRVQARGHAHGRGVQ